MEYLQDDFAVDGEFVDDVAEEEVAVVACGGVHAVFDEEAWPCEGHEAAQFEALRFVDDAVVDVRGGLFDEEAGALEEGDADAVGEW